MVDVPFHENDFPLDVVSAGFFSILVFTIDTGFIFEVSTLAYLDSIEAFLARPAATLVILILLVPLSYLVGMVLYTLVDRLAARPAIAKHLHGREKFNYVTVNEYLDKAFAESSPVEFRTRLRIMQLELLTSSPEPYKSLLFSFSRQKRALMVFHGAFLLAAVKVSTSLLRGDIPTGGAGSQGAGILVIAFFLLAFACVWAYRNTLDDEIDLTEEGYLLWLSQQIRGAKDNNASNTNADLVADEKTSEPESDSQ